MGSKTPSPSGNFSYPPPGTQLHFNYVDSLVTSWLTFDQNPTDCRLSIWYWQNDDNPWVIGYNQTAPANGTTILPLNIAGNGYLAQINFNYKASDDTDQYFLGPFFNVDDSPQSKAVIWSQGVLGGPTSSAGSKTSISASVLTSSALPAIITMFKKPASVVYPSATSSALPVSKTESVILSSATSSALPVSKAESVILSSATSSSLSASKPSATGGSNLGTGAIVEIIVGIVILAGLAAALVFYRRRKPVNVQAEVRAPSPDEFRSPVPGDFLGEKDGTPLRPKELSGDGQVLEMAT